MFDAQVPQVPADSALCGKAAGTPVVCDVIFVLVCFLSAVLQQSCGALARHAPCSQPAHGCDACTLQEEHPEITIVKIDTTDEELSKLADEEAVTVLPTFKFFKDGKEVCDARISAAASMYVILSAYNGIHYCQQQHVVSTL